MPIVSIFSSAISGGVCVVARKAIIERHYQLTGSERADEILGNWAEEKNNFWQVYPPSEAQSAVVSDSIIGETVKVSATAPSEELCYLPVGAGLSPDQTTRCAD